MKTKRRLNGQFTSIKIKARLAWNQLKDLILLLVLLNILIGQFAVKSESVSVVIRQAEQQAVSQVLDGEQPANDTEAKPLSELAELIYKRESSEGKNGFSKCKAVGKVNNIGYGIYGENWQCFESHDEEMSVLMAWLERHKAEGLTETEILCHYSGGNYKEC